MILAIVILLICIFYILSKLSEDKKEKRPTIQYENIPYVEEEMSDEYKDFLSAQLLPKIRSVMNPSSFDNLNEKWIEEKGYATEYIGKKHGIFRDDDVFINRSGGISSALA